MNTPLITWSCIAGLFLLIVIVHVCHAIIVSVKSKGKERIISLGSEREELFIPGDPLTRNLEQHESDYEDYDDL